jgi:hypothetical protein
MRKLFSIFFILISIVVNAQPQFHSLRFRFTFGGEDVELQKSYFSVAINDSIKLETVKFYVSNVHFEKDGEIVDTTSKRFYLIDLENKFSRDISFSSLGVKPCDTLEFSIGIDSLTNVSGAMGGALDPVNGMYWAWQSGYINFKIEGSSPACKTRHNVFQFHVGGYSSPFATIQNFKFAISKTDNVTIEIPLDELLEKIDIRKTNEVMSPSVKSTQIANQLSELIRIK